MSNPGEPAEPNNDQQETPWAWEAPLLDQSERQDTEWSLPKLSLPRFDRSAVSPLAPFALVFILGAILGGLCVVVVGHAAKAEPAVVVATPIPFSESTAVYTVTGINGTIIEAVGPGNVPISIFTLKNTSYQEGGLPATFADIKPGSQIVVKGHKGTTYSRVAARILLQDPAITGTIQGVSSSGIDVKTIDGTTITLTITTATKVVDARTNLPVNLSALKTGGKATAFGSMVASDVFGATVIDISA